MKRLLGYLAVVLLTVYCFFLYDDEILAILFVMEIIYLIFSVLWLAVLKKKVTVSMNSLIPIAEKNQTISVKLVVRNRSKWQSAHVRLYLSAENTFTKERKSAKKMVTVPAGKTEEVLVDFQSGSCGNIMISLKHYDLYDLFYILGWKFRSQEKQSVGILPECHLIPLEITRKTREFIAEAQEYSDRESGDDSSEVYQIRAYRDMDSLRDVHWKMSAKNDDLLVKEYGKPKGCVVLIWLNLQTDMIKRKQTPTAILEAAASLSLSLLEEDCVHMVAWYEKENQKIQKKRVSKEEHIYELLNRLLYTKMYQEDIEEEYQDAFRGLAFSSVVELKMDGSILVNEEEKIKLSLVEGENRWGEFYFIL